MVTLSQVVLIISTSSTILERSSLTESFSGTSSFPSLFLLASLEARSDANTFLAVLRKSIVSRGSGTFKVRRKKEGGKLKTVWERDDSQQALLYTAKSLTAACD